MTEIDEIAEIRIRSRTPRNDLDVAEDLLDEAFAHALKEYHPAPGEVLPTRENFVIRQSFNEGGAVILVVALTAAGVFGEGFLKGAGQELGKRTVAKIWDLVEDYIRSVRGGDAEVRRTGPDDEPPPAA